MSSKQLAVSADNLLSLQMDTCLSLSSSSSRCADSLPANLSPPVAAAAAAAVSELRSAKTRSCRPVRRRRRLGVRPVSCQQSSTQLAAATDVDSRTCLAATASSVDPAHNCSSDTLRNQSRDDQLQSDAAADSDAVCSTRVSRCARSGSHITRKKAFYNTERPLSIVRRDSPNCSSDECPSTS